MLGLSPATISAIENGKTAVTVERLSDLAAALGVAPVVLLASEDELGRRHDDPDPSPADRRSGVEDWRQFGPLPVDAVLAGAIACFVETGYHGATMRSIAARCGVAVSGVYHHYQSKQQLLVTILDLTMGELEWRLPAARDSADDGGRHGPLGRLAALVEAMALFHVRRADLAFIGASEMRSLDEPDRRRITARRSGVQHLLDREVDAAVALGVADTRMPREDARAIATMCTSLPQWFDPHGSTSAERIAREYADLAVRMVTGRPA